MNCNLRTTAAVASSILLSQGQVKYEGMLLKIIENRKFY